MKTGFRPHQIARARVPRLSDADARGLQALRHADLRERRRLDLAPEAPWSCPENCPSYIKRTWDAGWTLGALADTKPDPAAPEVEPENIAALLDMAEDVINTIGADVLAEHRAAQEKASKGRFAKLKRKRGKR